MAKQSRATKQKSHTSNSSQPRRLKNASYRSFRLHRRIRPLSAPLLPGRKIMLNSLRLIKKHWRLFAGLGLLYVVLTIMFVRGLTFSVDANNIRSNAQALFNGQWATFLTASALLSAIVGASSSANGSSAYQPILLITVALATIWLLRQLMADKQVRVRDGFYKGMYPVIPFFLVLMIIGLQLMPLALGAWLFTTVISNLIAVTAIEKTLWFILFLLLATLSLYMVTSSIFALLIVALPDMTPFKALRSARQLVLHRRWMVSRKLLFLPLFLVSVGLVIMLPFLIWLPRVAELVYFVISMISWPISITYLYNVYRELLHD